jgi:hypothetical protein
MKSPLKCLLIFTLLIQAGCRGGGAERREVSVSPPGTGIEIETSAQMERRIQALLRKEVLLARKEENKREIPPDDRWEGRFFERIRTLSDDERSVMSWQVLEYLHPGYAPHVIRRAWDVAEEAGKPGYGAIRNYLRDLISSGSAVDNDFSLTIKEYFWHWHYWHIPPEAFDIISLWCLSDYDVRVDYGARLFLDTFEKEFTDGNDWINTYMHTQAEEEIPLKARQPLHQEIRQWLEAHPEARSWCIQKWHEDYVNDYKNTQSTVDLAQGVFPLNIDTPDERARYVKDIRAILANIESEFSVELADHRGICGPDYAPVQLVSGPPPLHRKN